MLQGEVEWLLSSQLPGGAIAQTPDHQLVIPYFSNLAAAALLPYAPGRVKDYLLWYLDHLNDPDRWGLSGTIYDYQMRAGVLEPTMNYDSADSYAATFLSLVRQYVVATGDAGFARDNLASLHMIASVITGLQDRDGLVWAKPTHRVKYLMDNAENYRGLRDWAWLLEHLGLPEAAEEAGTRADLVRQGLESRLWDTGNEEYYWSDGLLGRRRVRTGRWYPDYVSQLYPLLNGLMDPDDQRALSAYNRIAGDFPRWHQGELPDLFPWALVAYAAALIGQQEAAREYLLTVAAGFARNGRPYPWYILESAYTIRTIELLGE
ncbi:MAG: hypothetical protein AB1445_01735 [Bacillota bacterium]